MSPALDRTFSTRDVMKRCRVTRRQVQLWREERLLRPLFHGRACFYSAADLRKASLIRDLIAKGLRYATIRRVLRQWAGKDSGYLLIGGDRRKTYFCAEQQDVLKVAGKARQAFLLVDLGVAA